MDAMEAFCSVSKKLCLVLRGPMGSGRISSGEAKRGTIGWAGWDHDEQRELANFPFVPSDRALRPARAQEVLTGAGLVGGFEGAARGMLSSWRRVAGLPPLAEEASGRSEALPAQLRDAPPYDAGALATLNRAELLSPQEAEAEAVRERKRGEMAERARERAREKRRERKRQKEADAVVDAVAAAVAGGGGRVAETRGEDVPETEQMVRD